MKFIELWSKIIKANNDEDFLELFEVGWLLNNLPPPDECHASALVYSNFRDNTNIFISGFALAISLIDKYGIPEDLNEIKEEHNKLMEEIKFNREDTLRNFYKGKEDWQSPFSKN